MDIKFVLAFLLLSGIWSCNSSEEKKRSYSDTTSRIIAQNEEQSPLQASMDRGAIVYMDFCMRCHQAEGKGVEGSFPPLAGADYLQNNRLESIRAVKYGQNEPIVVNSITYNGVMAAMGLSDQEVADVLNYSMNSWGNKQVKMVTETEVASVEK